jgi:hypothetical protein
MVSYSGYDFGYFVKLLTAESLPTTEDKFFALLRIWFPTVYDLKFLMRATKVLKGGLQEVADDLGVRFHVIPCLCCSVHIFSGHANRVVSSSRIRLAPDGLDLL